MEQTERSLHTLALLVIAFLSKETYIIQCEMLHKAPRAGVMFSYYTFLVLAAIVLLVQPLSKVAKKEVSNETK